jgi:hypothetical protein
MSQYDETYYMEKYLLLRDMIKNKSSELRTSFNDDMNISRIVRTTTGIYDSIVDECSNKDKI